MSAALMDTHTLTAVTLFGWYFIPIPESPFPNFFPIIMFPLERKHCNTFTEKRHPLVIICHPASKALAAVNAYILLILTQSTI